MNIKKLIKDNITYHVIKTNRFKEISIAIFLTKEFKKEDIAFSNMLIHNLTYSSLKYNSKDKISYKSEELYGLKLNATFEIIGALETICISLDFVNPKYTEEAYLNKSLEFLKEVINNPNVNNNEFNKEYFNIIKNDIIFKIKSLKDNPQNYASHNYNSLMYKGTPTSYSTLPNIEDIEKVTPKNLYDYYKKTFNNNCKIDVVILGDIEENAISKVQDKLMFLNGNNKNYNIMIKHTYSDNLKEKTQVLKFNQSKLYMGYRLNNLSYHELYHVLRIYNTILGTMNDSILFNVVREENYLCYSIGSYINKYNPSITIYAGINKNNSNKTIDLINKCVNDMNNKEIIKRLFDSSKKTINTYINNYYDDSVIQINREFLSEFESVEDIETYRKNIESVTIDEVINLNRKISLACIYLLKGDN